MSAATLLIWLATGALACPGPVSLGTGLSILTHNDLYGDTSFRQQSLLIGSTPSSQANAANICSQLGESLWNPQADDFLPYLSYEKQDGLYWAKSGCVNITTQGLGEAKTGCSGNLPVICTNSAPRSTSAKVDNSTYWGVEVKTGGHYLTGFRDKDAFRFEGVRFAAQPKRFTHSTPYSMSGNETALDFQSQCVQGPNVGSEDCLFLNIWTPSLPAPSSNKSALKPVMFWIHGGAFTGGSGSIYDGSALVSRGDVVVVTINYRLATLGFLALNDGVTNGNYGLGDQVTALDWIIQHIADFGGDKDRITLFGQSAGAASVRALMASPKAIGKFAAVIPQSNLAGSAYATTYSEYYNISTEVKVAATPILNATGCLNATSQVDCLRGIDPFVLANLSTVARYIVQDGTYITGPRLDLNGNGPSAKVPVLQGFMRDDGASFTTYPKSNTNITSVLGGIAGGYTSQQLSSSTLSLYPISSNPNATLALYNASSELATDAEFRCTDIAAAYSESQIFPSVYVYEFNRSYNGYDPNPPVCSAPPTAQYPLGDPSMEYFKCHSGELQYMFGSIIHDGAKDRDGYDIPFSQFSVDTWTSFARTYNPNIDSAYLAARGFTNTTQGIKDKWTPVSGGNVPVHVMQWPSYEGDTYVFSSEERCKAVGFPKTYYETL